MDLHLETYANWFPNSYNLKYYPTSVPKTFTVEERDLIYERLTKKQKGLIDENRKYRVRSLFLQNLYMKDSKWEFIGLNVDYNYKRSSDKGELFCYCGRRLKYQFVLKAKKGQQTVKLGISHFMDHLKIPQNVAEEIKRGVNQVDLALDELLWLFARKVVFPEDLWQRYVFAQYRNNTLKNPVVLNKKLAQRVLSFREAQMPIFIADYLSLQAEIKKVNKRAYERDEDTFVSEKATFLNFFRDFSNDVQQPFYEPIVFLNPKQTAILKERKVKNKDFQLDDTYFDAFLKTLIDSKQLSATKKEVQFQVFKEQGMNQQIDPAILKFIFEKYQQYEFTNNFLMGIPRVYRKGLKRAIQREKQAEKSKQQAKQRTKQSMKIIVKESIVLKSTTKSVEAITELVTAKMSNQKVDQTKKEQLLQNEGKSQEQVALNPTVFQAYLEWLALDQQLTPKESMELQRLVKGDIQRATINTHIFDKLFFDKLFNILTLPKKYQEEQITVLLDSLFRYYSIDDFATTLELQIGRRHYLNGEKIECAFSNCPREYVVELVKRDRV